jgi:ribose 5-phosphate isomerase A
LKPRQEWVENAKKSAAREAVKQVKDGFVIGLGSGSTAAFAIKEIGQRIRNEKLHVLGVPTSNQAFMLAVKHGVPVTTLDEHPRPDLAIDGADQIDDRLNLIKGMGGALAREKLVASASKKLLIIADAGKKVKILGENGHPVPIEVLPLAVPFVARKIKEARGKPCLRESARKVGPVVTDNGNFIIDAVFGPIAKPDELENRLQSVPGIVETGLFVRMVDVAFIGDASGVRKSTAR